MIANLKKWLADYFDTEEIKIESYFRNENVTGFLIIWTIYEQKLFNGFQKYTDLVKFSVDKIDICTDLILSEFDYFYYRYQDDDLYRNLVHQDSKENIRSILSTKKSDVKKTDKFLLVLYVVYRYRNNIFHGNKGVDSWSQYSTQIEKCVNVMIDLLKDKCCA